MRPAENIDKLIKKLQAKASAELDERVHSEISKALAESKKTQSAKPEPNIWRIIMKRPITRFAVAAGVVIVILIGINQFGGSIDGATVAFGDVIEKLENDIKSTNTIHILITMRTTVPKRGENSEGESVEPHIIKGECWLRRNPFAGKMVLEGEQTTYFTENKFTGLDPRSKKWFEQPVPKEKRNMYGMFDALVTGDFEAHQEIPGFSISAGQIVGDEIICGERATIYEFIGTPSKGKKEEGHPPIRFKCWVRDSDHKTVRMRTHYGEPDKFSMDYELIEYDVTIPPGTLEVKIPEGYTKYLTPEERIKATVPANIIELKRTYDNAREAFGDYRMVILDDKGYLKNRVVRQGKKWRMDNYRWRGNDKHPPQINQFQDFNDLWSQAEAFEGKLEVTLMTYKSKMGQGIWPRDDIDHNLAKSRLYRYRDINEQINSLEYIAWRMMYLGGKDTKIEMLPPSDNYPGCVGVRYSQITKQRKSFPHNPQIAMLVIFWIDPSRDYICIRYEHHQRPKAVWEEDNKWEPHELRSNAHDHNGHFHSEIVETTKLAQTPDGKWYPKEIRIQHHSINRDGTRVSPSRKAKIRRIYIDTQGPIEQNWFEWPEKLPPPSK